jgi:adenylate cyclase
LSCSGLDAILALCEGESLGERLDSWKEIARYLGREVRTVQRWALERSLPVHRLPGGDRPRVYALKSELDAWLRSGPTATGALDLPSVAVLPFVNLTDSRENEYFSDGLADEIINALSRIPSLRVTARTSSFAFRGNEQDVREIGFRLGVSTLLEGSVRRYGNRVRISAQHVSAKDGYHLWSESYDRELTDIFAIQDEIARSIARALCLHLSSEHLVEPSTNDLEAYKLWLKGRHSALQYTRQAVDQARECFAAAVARDPQFPLPYLGMAELLFDAAHVALVPPTEAATKAKEAVQSALALNNSLGEAHALLGALLGVFEYDWTGAERAFDCALMLSPSSSTVLERHAWYCLVSRLRIPEGIEQIRRAAIRDPLSARLHMRFGLIWIVAREYERAAEECRTALEIAPELHLARWFLGYALMMSGHEDEGLAECRKVYDNSGLSPLVTGGMCALYGILRREEDARRMFKELSELSRTAWVPPLAFAWAFLGLRDERVFEWLDKAIDARDPAITQLPLIPLYDGIRDDPRYHKLLTRMGMA